MTMSELCEYSITMRRKKCNDHLAEVRSSYGEIKSFTQKEWLQVEVKKKSVFRKGKTHAFRGLWNHYNMPIL